MNLPSLVSQREGQEEGLASAVLSAQEAVSASGWRFASRVSTQVQPSRIGNRAVFPSPGFESPPVWITVHWLHALKRQNPKTAWAPAPASSFIPRQREARPCD